MIYKKSTSYQWPLTRALQSFIQGDNKETKDQAIRAFNTLATKNPTNTSCWPHLTQPIFREMDKEKFSEEIFEQLKKKKQPCQHIRNIPEAILKTLIQKDKGRWEEAMKSECFSFDGDNWMIKNFFTHLPPVKIGINARRLIFEKYSNHLTLITEIFKSLFETPSTAEPDQTTSDNEVKKWEQAFQTHQNIALHLTKRPPNTATQSSVAEHIKTALSNGRCKLQVASIERKIAQYPKFNESLQQRHQDERKAMQQKHRDRQRQMQEEARSLQKQQEEERVQLLRKINLLKKNLQELQQLQKVSKPNKRSGELTQLGPQTKRQRTGQLFPPNGSTTTCQPPSQKTPSNDSTSQTKPSQRNGGV